ncbi:MAG: hypothetical protein MJ250_08195 [Alphaproteobacteria bacterium]|nr:hypothetical protein [Alphaproteobacteria bacterium]
MSLFSNKDLTRLNVHYGLREMGWQMCSTFTLAYLYNQGLPLHNVFFVYAIMLSVRTMTRPISMFFCLRKGVHWTLIWGTFAFALRYPSMLCVDGFNLKLLPFILFSGIADVMYWVPYHNYFASIGTADDRGASVGTREAISTMVSVLGPLVGGLFLAFDKTIAFAIPFALAILGIFPLLKTPSLPCPVKPTKQEIKRISPFGFWAFIGDGLFFQAGNIWPLIVFMILGESYSNFGYLMALAAVFRAVGSIVFGKLIDKGNGILICCIGYGIHMLVFTVRGFFAQTVPVIIACDFVYACAFCFSMTGLMAAIYNATKSSKHPIYFTYYTELGWDIGAISSMVLIGIMTYFGINVRWGLALSILGAIISLRVLIKYYKMQNLIKHRHMLRQFAQRNM